MEKHGKNSSGKTKNFQDCFLFPIALSDYLLNDAVFLNTLHEILDFHLIQIENHIFLDSQNIFLKKLIYRKIKLIKKKKILPYINFS